MKRFLILSLVFAICICNSFAGQLTVKTDKPDALYDLSSKAVFTVEVPAKGVLEYKLTLDGSDTLQSEKLDCGPGSVEISGMLDKPGFLRCEVVFTPEGGKEKQTGIAAAGYEPLQIKPASDTLPAEFDSFWNKRKSELACIPFNTVMSPIQSTDAKLQMYDVQVDCIGKPVSGYYARPVGAKKGSCPAILFLHGAGVYTATKGRISEYSREGFIALEINAHGIPNGKPAEYYKNLSLTTLRNYKHWGKESPYTSYFAQMFLRVVRALEFLKAQPEWDGKILISYGSSQGGAQALAAAGLDNDVTFMVAAVPAMCDHGGAINGWPRFVPRTRDGAYDQQYLKASQYVDSVNFARKAKAEAFFTVGFIDNTCRPTSVYAAYNTYAGEKEILNAPLYKHVFPADHCQAAKVRVMEYLKRNR